MSGLGVAASPVPRGTGWQRVGATRRQCGEAAQPGEERCGHTHGGELLQREHLRTAGRRADEHEVERACLQLRQHDVARGGEHEHHEGEGDEQRVLGAEPQ